MCSQQHAWVTWVLGLKFWRLLLSHSTQWARLIFRERPVDPSSSRQQLSGETPSYKQSPLTLSFCLCYCALLLSRRRKKGRDGFSFQTISQNSNSKAMWLQQPRGGRTRNLRFRTTHLCPSLGAAQYQSLQIEQWSGNLVWSQRNRNHLLLSHINWILEKPPRLIYCEDLKSQLGTQVEKLRNIYLPSQVLHSRVCLQQLEWVLGEPTLWYAVDSSSLLNSFFLRGIKAPS